MRNVLYVTLLILGFLGYLSYKQNNKPKIIYKDKIVYKVQKIRCIEPPKGVLVQLTLDDLRQDLKSSQLSNKNQQVLLDSLEKASKQYNIPVIVLYSLIYSESSFRFWIKHSLSTIKIGSKTIKTRAIGLGGIIYELWKDKLIKAKIIQTKSDLYQIEPNIMATAYILNYLKKEPLKKGTHNSLISAMRRYYGGNVKAYTYKVKQKMSELLYKKIFKE